MFSHAKNKMNTGKILRFKWKIFINWFID